VERISIVTTTLNAMPYIAETTRSVLQDGYPELEYILIDAGSTDGTLEHIMSLQDPRVKAEVIKGIRPYEAVDLGFKKSTGDVLAWLNGDDLYYPWTPSCVGKLFTKFPDVQWITGLPSFLDSEGHCTGAGGLSSHPRRYIQNGWFNESAYGYLQQEGMFWRRSLYEKAGGLNLKYEQAADFDLWARMAKHAELVAVTVPLAAFRRRGTNRSISGRDRYLRDVQDATKNLPKIGAIKNRICRASMATKHALRLAEWHRTSCISFSLTESRWKLGSVIRPISRESIQQLVMEFRGRSRVQRDICKA
jgi:glycosyltransferase involved in cell wall biosynthesis